VQVKEMSAEKEKNNSGDQVEYKFYIQDSNKSYLVWAASFFNPP